MRVNVVCGQLYVTRYLLSFEVKHKREFLSDSSASVDWVGSQNVASCDAKVRVQNWTKSSVDCVIVLCKSF